MKVLKFGGGCLRNPEYVMKVTKIVESEAKPLALVVSAIYGITDLLQKGILEAIRNEKKIQECIKSLKVNHLLFIDHLIHDRSFRKEISTGLDGKIQQIEKLLFGVAYTGEITESVRCQILSYGERLAADILAGILQSHGKTAVSLSAEEIGMITDEKFTNATAMLEETRNNFSHSLIPLMEKGVVPVITGFFGQTREGKISTFGRNGSDYSAAVVAYGLRATSLELWKDADGFMSVDPRIICDSRKIDRLSYKEAAELSYFGAKIMHPRTIEPLMEMGIEMNILNIQNPAKPGTIISPEGFQADTIIKGVTCNRHIALLKIYGPGVGCKPGIISKIGQALSNQQINIFSIITSQTSINLLVDKSDADQGFEVLKMIPEQAIEQVGMEDDVALIAIVGEGMLRKEGVAATVFSAVSGVRVNVEMISAGASEVSSYFIVKNNQAEHVIRALHREFFTIGNKCTSRQPCEFQC
jgi:aspartate kinase